MTHPTCDHCAGPAIVWQRYSGAHLCRRHFQESVEERTRKDLHRQARLPHGSRIAVAVSGGKDSLVALRLLADLRSHREDLELVALTIDEGIDGYRPPAIPIAAAACQELGIPHEARRTKDLAGVSVDEVHAADGDYGECSFCGVFRRRLMNDFAKDLGASFLVTGHNLDDMAQTVLMNLSSANLHRLAALGPHDTARQGLVPRLFPLRTIPETEVYLYATVRGLRWHDEECPYAERALRGAYRDALYRLEEARPGTRHGLLRTYETLRPLLVQLHGGAAMRECLRCGEPTSGTVCKACEFRERYAGAGIPAVTPKPT